MTSFPSFVSVKVPGTVAPLTLKERFPSEFTEVAPLKIDQVSLAPPVVQNVSAKLTDPLKSKFSAVAPLKLGAPPTSIPSKSFPRFPLVSEYWKPIPNQSPRNQKPNSVWTFSAIYSEKAVFSNLNFALTVQFPPFSVNLEALFCEPLFDPDDSLDLARNAPAF